jgi:MFS family permease
MQGSLLRNKNFISLLGGLSFAALADAIILVALPFALIEVTGSNNPVLLGNVLLFAALPRFSGFVLGAVVDKVRIKLPLICLNLVRTSSFICFTWYVTSDLSLAWPIYCLAFLNGLTAIFTSTAINVIVPVVAKGEQLSTANSLIQGAMTGVPLVGFGIGGILVTHDAAFSIAIASLGFLCTVVAFLFTQDARERDEKEGVSLGKNLRSGLLEIKKRPMLGILCLSTLVINATVMAINVLIPHEMIRLGLGASGYGTFEAILSSGVIMGLTAVALLKKVSLTLKLKIGLLLYMLSFLVLWFGTAVNYFIGAALIGFCAGTLSVVTITLVQKIADKSTLGKVSGTLSTFAAVGFAVGPFITGYLTTLVETPSIFGLSACLVGCLTLIVIFTQKRGEVMSFRTPTSTLGKGES